MLLKRGVWLTSSCPIFCNNGRRRLCNWKSPPLLNLSLRKSQYKKHRHLLLTIDFNHLKVMMFTVIDCSLCATAEQLQTITCTQGIFRQKSLPKLHFECPIYYWIFCKICRKWIIRPKMYPKCSNIDSHCLYYLQTIHFCFEKVHQKQILNF